MPKITLTTSQFIHQAQQTHGDRFDYSMVQFKNLSTPVTIVCKKHGSLCVKPWDHLKQKWGCRACYNEHQSITNAYSTKEFVDRAQQIHGDKYDYTKTVYKTNTKIVVTCVIHGDFLVNSNDHIYSKTGCTKCSGCYKMTTSEFITRAELTHHNKFDYSKVNYVNSSTKVTIICRLHGEFSQSPIGHIKGSGCAICSREQMVKNRIEKGHAIAPELKDPFDLYRETVRKLSNHNFRKYYHDINPLNLKRGKDWHLDHIISIAAGFANNIPAAQIADPSNLRIISAKDNRSKNVYTCDAVSSFDPNHIITKDLGEIAFKEKRKKHSNVYEITDTKTGEVKIVNLLIDWCKENGYSVSSARWSASYSNSLFMDRYSIKKIAGRSLNFE